MVALYLCSIELFNLQWRPSCKQNMALYGDLNITYSTLLAKYVIKLYSQIVKLNYRNSYDMFRKYNPYNKSSSKPHESPLDIEITLASVYWTQFWILLLQTTLKACAKAKIRSYVLVIILFLQ